MHKMQSGTGRKTYNKPENTSDYASQKNGNYQSNKYTMIVRGRRKFQNHFAPISNMTYQMIKVYKTCNHHSKSVILHIIHVLSYYYKDTFLSKMCNFYM